MPRSVNSVASRARRKKMFKLAKGFFGSRGNVLTVAKNTVEKGLQYAYRDRKTKKRTIRGLWIQRINAGVREHGMSYSTFIGKCHAGGIDLSRKVLADLAMNHPDAFKAIIEQVKNLTPTRSKDSTYEGKQVALAPASRSAKPLNKVEAKTKNAVVEAAPAAPKAKPAKVAKPAAAPAPDLFAAVPVEMEAPESVEAVGPKDDLKKMEGVGPAIEKLLNAAGINTWAQLAETEVEKLEAILSEAGSRFTTHKPGTWPAQAKLAAEGKWDELKAWQDQLDGGKE
ncbi:MAG: 50S ribosomal protein L20 [Bacteroidetes bacterium]|nr:50S ribosomal protein L20 [Bacteroidota bacterium]